MEGEDEVVMDTEDNVKTTKAATRDEISSQQGICDYIRD